MLMNNSKISPFLQKKLDYLDHLCKDFNLISISNMRNHVLKLKLEKQRKKGELYVLSDLYLICTFSFVNLMHVCI